MNTEFWHIALCRPGLDSIARRNLKMRGFVITQPTMIVVKRTKRREEMPAYVPIFPGYIFVRPSFNWDALRTAPGMRYGDAALMKINNRLALLRDDDPDYIMMKETEQRLQEIHKHNNEPTFKPGDKVRIQSGPWMDFWGLIEKLDSNQRVDCLIDMLGRKVRAHVRIEHLSYT